jgi:hypothetical protein
MSEDDSGKIADGWQLRAEQAEAALAETQKQAAERLLRAELKAEAIQAGMIDLDGIKLINLSDVAVSETGEVVDAGAVLAKLKHAKPWLFGQGRSSSVAAHAPKPEPPRARHANELSHEEWLLARAALLKRR